MRMKTIISLKTSPGPKAVRKGNGANHASAAKVTKKWRFAPDAIGMFNGPRDLSSRKGLSG